MLLARLSSSPCSWPVPFFILLANGVIEVFGFAG